MGRTAGLNCWGAAALGATQSTCLLILLLSIYLLFLLLIAIAVIILRFPFWCVSIEHVLQHERCRIKLDSTSTRPWYLLHGIQQRASNLWSYLVLLS